VQEYLIVDGYNIINAWSSLSAFKEKSYEHAREKLIELLSSYQGYKGIKIIIVFDAHLVKGGLEKRYSEGPLEIIYSREGETADAVIERLVYQLADNAVVTVATSDWEEQRIILGKGAYRISARELWNDLVLVQEKIRVSYSKSELNYQPNSVGERISFKQREIMEELRRRK